MIIMSPETLFIRYYQYHNIIIISVLFLHNIAIVPFDLTRSIRGL